MDGYVRIGTQVDTKDFDAEIKYIESQLEEIEHKLKQADMGFEVGDTQKLEAQYSRLVKQLDRLQKKQADLNKTDLSGVQKSIENVGKSTSKVITKMGKWALGIFAIESAYGFVRRTMSTLSQYNEKIASDVEYINFALASMLQPVIEGLIQLAYKLLTYVNYIAKAWFGIDLFANASADAMNKSAKSAEKMKKSLAGFDEMNVLNDNGSIGAMGAVAPSLDLASPEDVPIPSWIQWIADNKDLVISGLLGIASALVAVRIGLDPIRSLGIGMFLGGLLYAIQNLIKFLNDKTFKNFINIIKGIGLAFLGLSLIVMSIPLAIAGAIALIIGMVTDNFEEIKSFLSGIITWIETNFFDFMHDKFGKLGDEIVTVISFAFSFIRGSFESFYGGIKKVINGIIKMLKGDFLEGAKEVFIGFKDIALAPLNGIISGINALIRGINRIKFEVPKWIPTIGGEKFGLNIPTIPKLAVGGIVNMPSRGVPIGGAIAGESGTEGVIPLTDAQAMETLGATIGKYITINANITNTMNGRVISRELQKINTNNDFAMNR